MNSRLVLFIFFAVAFAVPATPPAAQEISAEKALQDRMLGSPEAPITIIEYSSLTCSQCAQFHTATMPELKRAWIDTGKARLIYRDFPLDQRAAAAAVVARCAPPERYFDIVHALYKQQDSWARAKSSAASQGAVSRLTGMSNGEIEKCLGNRPLIDGVLRIRLNAQQTLGISRTPTFIIEGKLVVGAVPFEKLDEFLRSLGG